MTKYNHDHHSNNNDSNHSHHIELPANSKSVGFRLIQQTKLTELRHWNSMEKSRRIFRADAELLSCTQSSPVVESVKNHGDAQGHIEGHHWDQSSGSTGLNKSRHTTRRSFQTGEFIPYIHHCFGVVVGV